MRKPHYRRTADGSTIQISDGLQSLATRLGTTADKAASVSYGITMLDDQQLEAAFRSSWVMRKVVTIPALDAVRKWREWSGKGKDADLVEELEDRFRVRAKVYDAKWKARLYGGAAILIGAGNEDLNLPLDPRSIGKGDLRYLTVITRKDITAGIADIDPRSPRYGLPIDYQFSTNTGEVLRVHPSRLVEFRGEPLPSQFLAGSGQYGWGDSVLQSVYMACQHLDMTMANIASLVFDAKTDVVKINGLSNNITDPVYEAMLYTRFATARMLKGNNGTLILDSEEEYQSKAYSFGGLSDIADRFMQVASGAADIPMTRFLNASPGGLNATGESDTNNYYDRVQAMQTLEIEPAMTILDEVLIRSALGDWPEDVTYEWRPLKQMTEAQISEIRNRDADTINKLVTAELFDPDEVAAAGAQMFRETGIDALTLAFDVFNGKGGDDAKMAMVPPQLAITADAAARTLYVSRKVLNGEEIIRWAKAQGFKTTLPVADLHVTIAFSRQPVDWMECGQSWRPKEEIPAGGPRQMEQFGEARVLLFASEELKWRHERIKEAGATWDHPDYQPHITISYDPDAPEIGAIEAYQGPIILGPEIFAEVKEDWAEGINET